MDKINDKIIANLNQFFDISNEIGTVKDRLGLPHFDPTRESDMLKAVQDKNRGPMPSDLMKRIFKEIFRASVEEMGVGSRQQLKVKRLPNGGDLIIEVNESRIGGEKPILIAGPCSVETLELLRRTAEKLTTLGVRFLRGGAFKPRTSPYSFQGLEVEGLKILRSVADEFNLSVVTEVLDTRDVPLVAEYADILQVGTRNMYNYSLLKELGKVDKPVLLKRSMMATIDEFIMAAEYVHVAGNPRIILCERGIRTFENQTRNTLDISAIPILKKETPLPVIVDVSHSLGRKDIVAPIAHAALAAGASGVMFEAHCEPAVALSDAEQQLDLKEAEALVEYLKDFYRFG